MDTMVTKKQLEEALKVIDQYTEQLHKHNISNVSNSAPHREGCRVRLSAWGLEMQGKKNKRKVGTVLYFDSWMYSVKQGVVTVKWDGISKPDSMDITQVQAASS